MAPPFKTSGVKVQSGVSGERGGPATTVAADERPQLAEAFKMLIPIAKEWQNIGVLLKLSDQDLKSIDTDGDSDINHLREMLRLWLSCVDRPPSWGTLAEAVELFDAEVAAKIKAIYFPSLS